MREIVSCQVGQCGNSIGTNFWERIAHEHQIDMDTTCNHGEGGGDHVGVYFDETPKGRFAPRCVLMDLDPSGMDWVRTTPVGNMFRANNFISGPESTCSNWARGFHTYGPELMDDALDVCRRETERCDCLQGFQLSHSLGGGTGSGMGSLLINRLKEEYPDRVLMTYSVLPSKLLSDSPIEPYHIILSLPHLIENADVCVCLDNESLCSHPPESEKARGPLLAEINNRITDAMSGGSCCMRFPGQLNSDMRRLAVSAVPSSPRLHFLSLGYATMSEAASEDALIERKMMLSADFHRGMCLWGHAQFRGSYPLTPMHRSKWGTAHTIHASICDASVPGVEASAAFMTNNTCVEEVFDRIEKRFTKLYRPKSFLKWYTGEGMDEMEFPEARESVTSLLSEYRELAPTSL